MRIAILSDAHGNKPFFDKIISAIDFQKPDKIIYLGDAFGYMSEGGYIFEELKQRDAFILKGNHESMLIGESKIDIEKDKLYGLVRQREILDQKMFEQLKQLPCAINLTFDEKTYAFMHGAPFDTLNGYLYENNDNYEWDDANADYIFMGHTHRMFIKRGTKTIFVNVGSCGLPRDIGLKPGYCMLNTESDCIELNRIEIDSSILKDTFFSGLQEEIFKVFMRKNYE